MKKQEYMAPSMVSTRLRTGLIASSGSNGMKHSEAQKKAGIADDSPLISDEPTTTGWDAKARPMSF
ncbi:MAG: hypothetical protein K6E54_06375 [Bacteroidaceae bacterium]|jgi:hypothetical protein|nr:hypothetical protein [Bacteroidaceae bacterium]